MAGRAVRDEAREQPADAVGGRISPTRSSSARTTALAGKLVRASRVIYSLQAREKLKRAARRLKPARRARPQHLSPPVAVDPVVAARPRNPGRHDGARPEARLSRLHHDARQQAVRELPRRQGAQRSPEQVHQGLGRAERRRHGGGRRSSDAPHLRVRRHTLRGAEPFRARDAGALGLAARAPSCYIPNFVDVERFRPGDGIGRRFVYCGRLDALKGVETLVRAAALARSSRSPSWARGPQEARLRELAAELGADVSFRGHLAKDALIEVLQSARAIVIPSEVNENAPLSLLEAYATARPVIGSQHRRHSRAHSRGRDRRAVSNRRCARARGSRSNVLRCFRTAASPTWARRGGAGSSRTSIRQSIANAFSRSTPRWSSSPHEHGVALTADCSRSRSPVCASQCSGCAASRMCRAASSGMSRICRVS